MSISDLKSSDSYGKRALLRTSSTKAMEIGHVAGRVTGETSSLQWDFNALSVSKRLARSVSQKWKNKHKKGDNEEQDGNSKRVVSGCLCLYGKGGGCKVGADTTEESGDGTDTRRKSNAGEECMGYRTISISGMDQARIDCFSNGMAERLWRRNSRKVKEIEQGQPSNPPQYLLPDEVLEMCLARVPLTTLMNARLVCRKWRALTSSAHFMLLRAKGGYQSPYLFVFGLVKDGLCSGQIHVYDASLHQWHKIGADLLQGRFSFSVARVGTEIYVVGGCTNLSNLGRFDRHPFQTHRSVLVFNPLTGSWRTAASMKSARSLPILGVFEVDSGSLVFQTRQNWQDPSLSRSRTHGVSDVYEDPHRLSLRRQLRDGNNESEFPTEPMRKSFKLVKQDNSHGDRKHCKRFILIAVGGQGSWDGPLHSAEIYDPMSNKWIEIPRLPEDFGVVSTGVVCKGRFYVCSETNNLAAFDMEKGLWIGIQTTHFPSRLHEYYPKLVSCNDQLFLLCVSWCERDGHLNLREKAVRKLWELDLTFLHWSEVSGHPDAPMDWNAAFVGDRGKIYGIEMFKVFGQVLDFLTVCDVSKISEVNWSWISRKHLSHEVDSSSCLTKSMVVLHL